MVHAEEEKAEKRFGVKASERVMDPQNLRKIAQEVKDKSILLVSTALNGEPLMGPHYQENVEILKDCDLNVITHTNGVLLNESTAQFMVDMEVDVVSISLDACTSETYKKIRRNNKFDDIKQNIFRLLELRGSKIKPRIEVSFTRTEDNKHEEQDFINYWSEYVDVIRTNGTVSPNEHIAYANIEIPKKRIPCATLVETIPIFFNGDVGLCCLDPFCDYKMGNVFETSVNEVWNGAGFEEMRKLHLEGRWDEIPICKNCDSWANHAYVEEKTDRFLIRKSLLYTYYNVLEKLDSWQVKGTHELKAGK